MSLLVAASLVWLAPPAAGSADSPLPPRAARLEEAAASRVRSVQELRAAVSAALRASARSAGAAPQEVVPGLVALYGELQSDTRLVASERQDLLAKLRSRLRQIETQMVRELKRAAPSAKLAGKSRPPQPASVKVPASHPAGTTILAQQFGGAGQPATGAAGGSPNQADGWELVALIRNTIAPETWDVNGGTGSISFYSPLNVLVVRQSEAVHDEVKDVLGQLRR
jgi:hypothetical protein